MVAEKESILIYGAGAIGRGFLAPTFYNLGYEIYFVDSNPELVNEMRKRNSYKTAFSKEGDYELIDVSYTNVFLPGEEDNIIPHVDFVFSCVGPNNLQSFAKKLSNAKCIISFENEYESVEKIKQLSGNENCYFGVPDVITSNDAPSELKKIDSLCLVSERGEFAIEGGDFTLPRETPIYSKGELDKYWACKFYLHNTPHATAAFLGKMFGSTYLHEAMQIPLIEKAVVSVMESTKKAMKIKKIADPKFIDFYAAKEIQRFKDPLLFDPVSRVGRDPLRKLRKNDRLIGSLKFISETDQDPTGALLTLKAAMLDVFENYNKEAFELLGEAPCERNILEKLAGVPIGSKLYKQVIEANLFKMLFVKDTHAERVRVPIRSA